MREYFELFEDCHEFFKTIVDNSQVQFCKLEPPTACACWDEKSDNFKILIDKEFWEGEDMDYMSRSFVIAHELCHIVFQHMKRFKEHNGDSKAMVAANMGMDVFVNHFCDRVLGIKRQSINDFLRKETCWVDTVFDDNSIPKDESSEFYYNRIKKDIEENEDWEEFFAGKKELVFDPFGEMKDGDGKPINADLPQKAINKMNDLLVEASNKLGKTKDALIEDICAGKGVGSEQHVNVKTVRKKPWESVIKKWMRKATNTSRAKQKRWGYTDRKFNEVLKNGSIELPANTHVNFANPKNSRLNLWLFLDSSGSCIHLKDRFFSAAMGIPKNKFNLRLFSFDTKVYSLNLKDKRVFGGGGTYFHIMEEEIQKIMREERVKYPDQIFVISDGYGNAFQCEKPERWQWFMTEQNSTNSIPKGSKIHKLNNYA